MTNTYYIVYDTRDYRYIPKGWKLLYKYGPSEDDITYYVQYKKIETEEEFQKCKQVETKYYKILTNKEMLEELEYALSNQYFLFVLEDKIKKKIKEFEVK